jgi:hypothetical protein
MNETTERPATPTNQLSISINTTSTASYPKYRLLVHKNVRSYATLRLCHLRLWCLYYVSRTFQQSQISNRSGRPGVFIVLMHHDLSGGYTTQYNANLINKKLVYDGQICCGRSLFCGEIHSCSMDNF